LFTGPLDLNIYPVIDYTTGVVNPLAAYHGLVLNPCPESIAKNSMPAYKAGTILKGFQQHLLLIFLYITDAPDLYNKII
jgi:hypothetical protein